MKKAIKAILITFSVLIVLAGCGLVFYHLGPYTELEKSRIEKQLGKLYGGGRALWNCLSKYERGSNRPQSLVDRLLANRFSMLSGQMAPDALKKRCAFCTG